MARGAQSSRTWQSIRDKVESGERLTFDDGLYLMQPQVPLHDVGQLANLVRERLSGNLCLLQHQYAPEPDKRVRLSVHVLCLSIRPAGCKRLRDVGRADSGARARGGRTRLH